MKKILLSLFLIFMALAMQAQNGYWEEAKGPYGGNFTLVKTPNEVLYATNDFVWEQTYRSTNGGESWDQLTFLKQAFPNAISKIVYVGASGTVFIKVYLEPDGWRWYRTNNDGQTWVAMNCPSFGFLETPSGVLFSKQTIGLLRSIDGGQTWDTSLVDSRTLIPVNDPFVGLTAKPNTVGVDVIFRSADEGLTWDTISSPFFSESYFFTPSGTLLCTEYDSKQLFRSDDGGESFQPISDSLEYFNVFSSTALLGGRILMNGFDYNVGKARTYYSDDDGISWQILAVDSWVWNYNYFDPISPLADGKIFANGSIASTNGGVSWEFSGIGMRGAGIDKLKFVTDSIIYASNWVGFWKTENAGETWTLLEPTYQSQHNGFEVTSTGGLILRDDYRLLWSVNGNNGFIDITPPDSLYGYEIFVNPSNDHFYYSTKKGLERSSNFGQSWQLLLDNVYCNSMVFHPSGRIIAAGLGAKIYFSDNQGSLWQSVEVQNADGFSFLSIAPSGDIYAIGFINSVYYMWKSEDVGQTWNQLPPSLSDILFEPAKKFVIADNGHLYRCNDDDEVFVSVNEGLTWQTLPSPNTIGSAYGYVTISPDQHLYFCSRFGEFFKSKSPLTEGAYIEGHVKVDADADCSTPDAQQPIQNRIIEADGTYNYFTNTDPDGHYIFFVDTGNYQVTVQNPSGIWWDYCEDSISVELPELFVTDTADFVAVPLAFCPLMTVNVAIPLLRRCFDNEVYVEYCNQGTELADSAWVDVLLDPYLAFASSSQPHEDLGGNTLRFFVGDVPPGECGDFQLTVHVDCDSTVLGQTHCVTAHGFPDTLCTTVPNWSGANIEASVTCQDTVLQFKIENTGSAPSEILDYIIIEDDVVLMTGQDDYDIAEDLVLEFPASGSTWRIESEQEPGHPFSTLALAFAEGCGGFGSLGYINQFTVNGIQPSWHRMCVENTGSYDPNDKQGFPTGTGSEHNIRPGQTIDYLIRFQNTGTDTAFTVMLRDTLSPFLDPLSIRPGASSHPYTWSLSGQGVITFSFNNIMLPDSNVNEPRSHGFVQFSIAPYPDVPLGSVIENNAAIYFDFNAPVITNTTWHTIQESPLTSTNSPEPKALASGLEVWPNPFSDRTNIHVVKKTSGSYLLKVFDSRGSIVAQKTAFSPDIEINTKHLPAGLYWAEIRDTQGRLVGSGKLVKE